MEILFSSAPSLFERFQESVVSWQALSASQAALGLAAVSGTGLVWILAKSAKAEAARSAELAQDEFRRIVRLRVDREQWDLLEPDRIKALAVTVQNKFGSVAFTDLAIAESIRALCLEYEESDNLAQREIGRAHV